VNRWRECVEVIKKAPQPVLEFAGGIADGLAFWRAHRLMERLAPAKVMTREAASAVFPGRNHWRGHFQEPADENTVWHSTVTRFKALPKGFRRTASNETCAIQAMQHTERPLFGVHFTPNSSAGISRRQKVLENFSRDVVSTPPPTQNLAAGFSLTSLPIAA